jgi:ATP citrate (pro-S)-lyase
MLDNIIASKLYRAGSVGYVSKSGGMSNELNNILSLVTNGTYEGIAIGGDRYPGSTFIDHLLRYEKDPECKMLVLLGEVGGIEEYRVIDAVKNGIIKKPIVAWAIGTCAKMFATEVQFGHAGSMANSDRETADAKNRAMREAGFVVPDTFEDLPTVLKETYDKLVASGTVKPKPEREPPVIPMDYKWAQVCVGRELDCLIDVDLCFLGRNLVSFVNLRRSSLPSRTSVVRSFFMPACAFRRFSRRTSGLVVSSVCCGSNVVCRLGRPSS